MKCLVLFATLLLSACAGTDRLAPRPERTAYVGGLVWDGEGFRARDLVVEGDHIVDAPAGGASQRVELEGGYVVPPFCEAHNHNLGLGLPDENEAAIARYLREGIFYVGVLSNLPALSDPIRHTYNTPASVDVALASGVDVIAHLPGASIPTRIDPADARLVAERGVSVMTTAVLIERPSRKERHAALREAQIANLRLLRDTGVTLAAGSDEYDETSSAEIAHLRALGVFSDAELLRMWSTNCARTLFPARRVGGLDPGNEASFLVLGADPLADFEATRRIALRVKDGRILDLGPPPPD